MTKKIERPATYDKDAKVVHDTHGFGVVTRNRPAGLRKPDPTYIYVIFKSDGVGRFVSPEALRPAHPNQIG